MSELVSMFLTEIKSFTKSNWWVFIVYIILMVCVKVIYPEKFLSAFIITSFHFIADIFIMMMLSAYHNSNYKQGAYFQIFSMLLFFALKLHVGFDSGNWHFLTADLIYVLAAIKNYTLDVKNIEIKSINIYTTTLLSLIVVSILIFYKVQYGWEIFVHESTWLTTSGIFLFAISLSITGNESSRFIFSIIALFLMVIGAGWETYRALSTQLGLGFINDPPEIHGLELSYFLLPLTVLVFNIKSWTSVDKNQASLIKN